MKRLLIGLASIVSMQALALPNIAVQNVTFHNQYSFDFNTPSSVFSVAETSNERTLNSGTLAYSPDADPFGEVSAELGSFDPSSGSVFGLRAVVSDNGIFPEDPEIIATGFDYSASTSINILFDVIGDSVELFRLGTSRGTTAEHAFSITGNGTNISDNSIVNGSGFFSDSLILTQGSYNLYADLNVIGISDDAAWLTLDFQEVTSVPEPYTPLLAAVGLFMMIRSRKNAK